VQLQGRVLIVLITFKSYEERRRIRNRFLLSELVT
jgi:hypothetical protein